jgi:hypothetical protein
MFNWLIKGRPTKNGWDSWHETADRFFDEPNMNWVHWQVSEFIVELIEFFDVPSILSNTKYGAYPYSDNCPSIYESLIRHWQFGILFRYHTGGDGKRWLFRLFSWRKAKRVGRIRYFFYRVGCRLQDRWNIVI